MYKKITGQLTNEAVMFWRELLGVTYAGLKYSIVISLKLSRINNYKWILAVLQFGFVLLWNFVLQYITQCTYS